MSALITVLIADDLTGALDSIAPFAALGMDCVAAVSLDAIGSALALSPQVLAVNLGTREVSPDEARAKAAVAARALVKAAGPGTLWIKKIDSRLKGPISAEIAGISDILRPKRLLLCPAIPELGRFVSQGFLRGHGVATDIPVAEAVAVDLPCDVPDATSDADLDRLAVSVRPGTLVAAARGLAAALARRIRRDHRSAPARMPRGPVGFVIGSRDPVTLAQVAQLRGSGGPRIIMAPDGEIRPEDAPGSFVIQATSGAGAEGKVVSARLAEGVSHHVSCLRTLVLTGGETAAAVLDALGIRLLRVEGEVLPGLPLCHPIGSPGLPALITKSGGFGPPDTLMRLWQAAQTPEGCPSP
jgi:D-threonate/D-erythronate kinase